jgi:hypothetical protein
MKTSLSLGLMFTALSTFAACSSDDEGAVRGAGGTSSTTAGAGGQVAGGAGGTGGGAAGTTSGGGTGGAAAVGRLGAALTIDAEGNVKDTAATTGIDGGASSSSSSVMTVPAVATYKEGGLCFKGTTATVPDGDSYGTHWGAQLQLDLKRVPNPDAPPAAEGDAGTDAGTIGLVAGNWPEGDVIGFAYTLVGNDAVAADKGVPAAHFRFKALPQGASNTDDNYCMDRTPVSGTEERVLFSQINFECWTAGNYSLAEDQIQYVQTPDPNKVVGTRPNPKALLNISWQIASDLAIAPIAFDFCVTDLKPIYAQ